MWPEKGFICKPRRFKFARDGWHRQFLLISLKFVDIKPVGQLLLLLLSNPGNKLPGLPDYPMPKKHIEGKVLINVLLTIL
jgi:hypothetical protein